MDLTLSDTQQLLSDSARALLTNRADFERLRAVEDSPLGFDTALWAEMTASGWTDLVAGGWDEESDGLMATLLSELGRAAVASPFFQTVAAAGLMAASLGDTPARDACLARIADGAKSALLASAGLPGLARGTMQAEEITLNGGPYYIEWAHVAEQLVCPVRVGAGFVLVLLDPGDAGVSITPLRATDNERVAQVDLCNVRLGRDRLLTGEAVPAAKVEHALLRMRVLRATEMAGGTAHVLELTTQYVKERHQFGRPLAALQSVQHVCADMAIEADAAWLATWEAVTMMGHADAFAPRAAIATYIAGRAYERTTQMAAQVHGGMGSMAEYPLQFYYRRAKAQRLRLGSIPMQLEAVARHVVDRTAASGTFPTRELIVAED